MKKQRNYFYFLLTAFISLNLACQDRLIVLWDEVPLMPLQVSQLFQVDQPTTVANEHVSLQADALHQGKVDIIMAIDCSGSMGDELSYVKVSHVAVNG